MSLHLKNYQIEIHDESPSDCPYINLWRAVCASAWCDYLGLTGRIDNCNLRNRRIDAKRFLLSDDYEQLREIVGFPSFREWRPS